METQAQKRGRPPKPPEERRTEVVYVKLTPAEKALIAERIDEPSVYAREALLRAAKRRS